MTETKFSPSTSQETLSQAAYLKHPPVADGVKTWSELLADLSTTPGPQENIMDLMKAAANLNGETAGGLYRESGLLIKKLCTTKKNKKTNAFILTHEHTKMMDTIVKNLNKIADGSPG
ncbi:hypothetical protein ADUPG1_010940, partial [Aduncisulcus paluster]